MPIRLAAAALLCVVSVAGAAEFRLPLLPRPPRLTGRLDDPIWAEALHFDGLTWGGNLERRRAVAWVAADETHLYLAIRSQLPADGPISAEIDRDTLKLVYDDAIEVWVDPTPGAANGRVYQMLANALGHQAYKSESRGNVAAHPEWEGHWQFKTYVGDGAWSCEVAVPIAEIDPGRKVTDGAWGINLCRDWKPDWAWSGLAGDSYPPSCRFTFDPAAPAIAEHEAGDVYLGRLDHSLTVSNPGRDPLTVNATLSVTRDVMPELKQDETLTLPPGGTRTLNVKADDNSTQRFTLAAKVTDPTGAVTYFDRGYGWKRGAPWRWVTTKKIVPPVDFQFAYYPYTNRLRALVDVANLPKDAALERAVLTLRKKGGATVKELTFTAFDHGKAEQSVDLPPLDGSYELAMKLAGHNVPAGELVKPLERTVYEWEHTALGRSRTVYPPFTPLAYKDGKLSCVLREHTINKMGLCDQIVAAGKQLLAAPMRFTMRVDGKDLAFTEEPAQVPPVDVQPDRAHFNGLLAAGPQTLELAYGTTWDVDGSLRYVLMLLPDKTANPRPIDSLTLDIPLRDDQATLIHAMGDSIRNTVYRKVPPGQGVVWDASKVRGEDLPRNFCSYIYVGGPVRGLCWFAENDKGWGWDRSKPNLELVREGETLTLRTHLINQPTVIDKAGTIIFGLQAAPIKPKMGDWRYRWNRDHYSLLGTDINWLALGDCGSVYPAGKDMVFWDMIKRGNTEHLTDADIDATIKRGLPLFEPYGQDKVNVWKAHVRYNLRSRYGTKMVFYYNRSSFQRADEFQTFQDEWDKTDWRSVGPGNGIWEIPIVPSESYIDHAVYWYAKSFELGGNRGVYWDNWFFQGDYNTGMTAAYHNADGSITPSTGLWGLRELSRRTFQMMNEKGMTPITMPHMTSTNILPMHGFATVQYDWEWKYSEGDVQDRFPREYILLVSNGELAGTWPVLLGDHGKLESDPWTQRTFAAVCLVHELNGYGVPKVWDPLLKPVYAILDEPGVEAWRYWDERPQPIAADDPDLPTVVYSVKGKQALFVVTSYAAEDRTANLRIDPAALGFTKGYKVTDVETGAELTVTGDKLSFPLKKHDLRECRIEALP